MNDVPICPLGKNELVEHENGMLQCPDCGYSEPGSNYLPPANEWKSSVYDNDDEDGVTSF